VAATSWLSAMECHLHPRLDPAVFADYISQKAFSLSRRGKWREAVRTIEEYLATTQQAPGSVLCADHDAVVVWDRLCLQLGQILLDAKQYTAAQASLLQCRTCAASLALLAIVHLEFYNDRDKALGFAHAALPKLMLYEKSLACFRVLQDVTALCVANTYLAHECHDQQLFERRDRAAAEAVALQKEVVESTTPLPDSEELSSFIDKFALSGRAVLFPRL
jgi:hypothetical protein